MAKQTTIEYRSESGNVYKVKLNPKRGGFCTCPAWRFQKQSPKNRTCKHIRAIRADMANLLPNVA